MIEAEVPNRSKSLAERNQGRCRPNDCTGKHIVPCRSKAKRIKFIDIAAKNRANYQL